jgi:hypothetical protein
MGTYVSNRESGALSDPLTKPHRHNQRLENPLFRNRRNRPMKTTAAVLGALAAAGLVVASAATLGGINSGELGADYSAVASCDSNGIVVNWDPSYDQNIPNYAIGDVDISDIDPACAGQNVKVELTKADGSSLGQEIDPLAVTSPTYSVSFTTPVDAALVEGIAVTIYE